eukprot:243920-Pleurochrysis_carterae.AAC.1
MGGHSFQTLSTEVVRAAALAAAAATAAAMAAYASHHASRSLSERRAPSQAVPPKVPTSSSSYGEQQSRFTAPRPGCKDHAPMDMQCDGCNDADDAADNES